MKPVFSTEFKVGITIIAATLILIFGIIWGKGFRLQPNKYKLDVVFENVGGMVPGDPVTVNGVKVGKVAKIGWYGRDVLCTIELNNDVQLYEDATFIVISAELLAGMRIEIFPGISEKKINLSRQPFRGKYGGRIVDVGLTIDALSRDLSALTFRIDTTMAMINRMLESGSLQESLQGTLQNLSSLTHDMHTLPQHLSHTLTGLDTTINKLNHMVESNDQDLSSAIRNLNSISSQLDTVSSSLKVVLGKIENKEGTLGKMVYDSTLYINLSNTLLTVDSLARKLKDEGLDLDLF